MNFKRIEITQTDIGFTVEVDDMFADGLSKDEALGVVASAFFGPENTAPIFVNTYQVWAARDKRHREMCGFDPRTISGLLV